MKITENKSGNGRKWRGREREREKRDKKVIAGDSLEDRRAWHERSAGNEGKMSENETECQDGVRGSE